MKKSRLEELLEQFSPKELKKLRKFLCSPFFNQQQNLIKLFDYCVAQKGQLMEKPMAYRAMFPNKSYKDADLRLQMSYLYRLVEKFVAYTQMESNDFLILQHTLADFQERNLSEFGQRTLKKAKNYLEKQALRDADYYNQLYQLNLAQYTYEVNTKPAEQQDVAAFQELDIAYYITKLKLACFLLSQQTTYQSNYDLSTLAPVLAQIEEQNLLTIPTLATFYFCYFTLVQPEVASHFEQFNELLLKHSQQFSQEDNGNLYLLAINYCIKQINQGNTAFNKKTLKLYKAGLKNEALLENGILSRFTYHNIVMAGIRNQAWDWVEQFIHQYRRNLEKRYQESSFSFSLAHLAYHRKDYAGVLNLLQTANYRDVLLNLGAKTLLLKVYYELGELNLLHSHLDAMKNYIRRKRVIGYHKTNYMNIVRFTQKLLSLNFYDKVAVGKLKAIIQSEAILTERQWLLEQIGVLTEIVLKK
ncbi:MAG: hypothetical protein AAGJ18_24555 [Bacteroidota bacterium]